MRDLAFLGLALAITTGCGGDTSAGGSNSGSHSDGGPGSGGGSSAGAGGTGGAGGASSGGAGTECTTSAQCPQLGCYMCPAYFCMNGRCVTSSVPGNGGMTGSGGAGGNLKWFTTCGPPVCQAPTPGAGGSSSGVPRCTSAEAAGMDCNTADAQCDPGASCSGPLKCTTSDPTHGGQCPISRAKYKQDIEYVSAAERAKLAEDVQSIPLVRYRYKDGPEREHLGFIIEDVEPSPSVDSQHDRVDLYGYTSMAIAALQEQRREIESLKAEIKELRAKAKLSP